MSWWKYVKHFKPEEFGEPGLMDPRLIFALDRLRERFGAFVVTSAYATRGHAAKSYHYVGRAVDGYFVDADHREVLKAAVSEPVINGIGVYYDWRHSPGFHFDSRDGPLVLWKRDGEYSYFLEG